MLKKQRRQQEHNLHPRNQTTSSLKIVTFTILVLFFLLLFFASSSLNLQKSYSNKFKPTDASISNFSSSTSYNSKPWKDTTASCELIPGISPFYIYTLPPKFNTALLERCHTLIRRTDMCRYIVNNGLGQPLIKNSTTVLSSSSWFDTNQYTAEIIFHARVSSHPCRVHDPSKAGLFYVPFYGGLYAHSVFPVRNLTARDSLMRELADYLTSQQPFRQSAGSDHFLVLGRMGMDFMRPVNSTNPGYGQNSLFNLPSLRNVSFLSIERAKAAGSDRKQFAIPLPSYFHPTTSTQMKNWQDFILNSTKRRRTHLFSFIGATRKRLGKKGALRDTIINQCNSSTRGALLDCSGDVNLARCMDPVQVMEMSIASDFCLQPPGDSFTRRSTFDSMLAGCVPVFFSPYSAYTQWGWYLPEKEEEGEDMIRATRVRKYSVYIDMESRDRKTIEQVLSRIKVDDVWRIRENIVKILPRVTYMNPDYKPDQSDNTKTARRAGGGDGVYDAVDVTLQELSRRVNVVQVDRRKGR